MIENSKSKIRQFLPRHSLFPLVSLGDFLRKKAFSRNPEMAVKQEVYAINSVIGENLQAGNAVQGSSVPVFARGRDEGEGEWIAK